MESIYAHRCGLSGRWAESWGTWHLMKWKTNEPHIQMVVCMMMMMMFRGSNGRLTTENDGNKDDTKWWEKIIMGKQSDKELNLFSIYKFSRLLCCTPRRSITPLSVRLSPHVRPILFNHSTIIVLRGHWSFRRDKNWIEIVSKRMLGMLRHAMGREDPFLYSSSLRRPS